MSHRYLVACLSLACLFFFGCASAEPRCISFPPAPQGAQGIKNAVPIFRATDVLKSAAYYVDVLGFKRDWTYRHEPEGETIYAAMSRGGASVHLSKNSGTKDAVAYFYVNGVDALHDEWRAAGAKILYDPHASVQGPQDQPWGVREIYVADPDGNTLRFGQLLE